MKKLLLFLSGGLVFMIVAFFLLNSYVGAMVNYSLQNQTNDLTTQNQGDFFLISIAHAQQASGNPNPTCFDNYQSWTSSTTFKPDAPWSTAFVTPVNQLGAASYNSYNMFANNFERDINGDGIADYVFVHHKNVYTTGGAVNYTQTADCVYISNGSGWEAAYQCVTKNPSGNTVNFYGDCAQV